MTLLDVTYHEAQQCPVPAPDVPDFGDLVLVVEEVPVVVAVDGGEELLGGDGALVETNHGSKT